MTCAAFAACSAILAACSAAQTSSPASSSSAATLPCDVADVMHAHCAECHAVTPRFGAPMPLVTYEDTQLAAPGDPSKKVWERMGARVHDAARPMPPSAVLPPGDLARLDAWVGAGAPPGDATCAARPPAEDFAAGTGAASLPCPESEQSVFRAHAPDGADAKFHVPADAGNLYECFTWKTPWTADTQATAFAPIIDDARVVHHWILYETSTPQAEGGVGGCRMPADATFLQGWAPGGKGSRMPAEVGLAMPSGPGKWLILQVHYWNVKGLTDARDRSGVALCTTKPGELRPQTAVVSTLGSLAIALPPRSTGTAVTGSCTPVLTEPAHVLSAGPHMHGRGRSIKTEILRGGDPSRGEMLVDVPRWDFETQNSYPSDLLIQPGDVLRTTCTYDNPDDKSVFFGERTEDEMCFDFVAVYPPPGLVTNGGRATRRCIDPPAR